MSSPQLLEEAAPSRTRFDGEPVLRSPSRFPTPRPDVGRWTPHSATPPELVDAVRLLFDRMGMVDTRRLELRHATVHVGSIWGGHDSLDTIAWLLPNVIEGRPFVLGRNGLVYAAERVGEPASATDAIAEQPDSEASEAQALIQAGGLVWILQLLRAGENDAAREAWERVVATIDPARAHPRFDGPSVASDWVWTRVERAVCAHMRGDDPLALHDARVATRLLREHGELLDERETGGDVARLLLADQERRLAEGETRLPREEIASPTRDVSIRIPELIRELDQVASRQWGQPGAVNLADDVVVRELITIGDPAVEALLEALESDTRLTRSVHFWRDFSRNRTVLGVHEAAYAALATILETDFFSPTATGDNLTRRGAEGRRELARSIRTYWERFRGLPPYERWLVVLQDDDAAPQHWVDAAQKLTTASNVRIQRGSMTMGPWTTRTHNTSNALRGEPLRDQRNPSVTELLVSRLVPTSDESCSLAGAIARWDPVGGRGALESQLRRCEQATCWCTPQLFDLLGERRGVLRRYAAWLSRTPPEVIEEHDLISLLYPAINRPDDALLERAVQRLLDRLEPNVLVTGHVREELLELRPFRNLLARMLEDVEVIGTVSIGPTGRYSYRVANGGGGGGSTEIRLPALIDVREDAPLRRCDSIAIKIHHRDAPEYQIYWDQAGRDAGLTALIQWLRSR